MSLKQKTIRGVSWAFIDRFSAQVIQFITGIILARLLLPEEYGLIGMLSIFMAIADTFVNTGFGEALIQKTNPSKEDFSTVFWCNMGVGLFCYVALFFSAPLISSFFNEPILQDIIVVFGLTIVINAVGMPPRAPIIKRLDFKTVTKMSIVATFLSGAIAICLAFSGYGVWSLVWRGIVYSSTLTVMVFIITKPRYDFVFKKKSFIELFGFGSRLIASRLLNEIYQNIYYVIIGKFFSPRELGLYTRANGYKNLPSKALNNVIQNVSFPALATIKDKPIHLKKAFRKVLQVTMYLTFLLMFSLAGLADNFILGLIGQKWIEAVPYLQLLCFAGVFYPLTYLNLSLLTIRGRTDIHLNIEIIRKIFALPIIAICIFVGIKAMIIGLIVSSVFDYGLVSYWSGKQIDYPILEQIKDVAPSFLLGAGIGLVVHALGSILDYRPLIILLLQGLIGAILALALSIQFRVKPFLEMKAILIKMINPTSRWN